MFNDNDPNNVLGKNPHPLPKSWSWRRQHDVFSFQGGAQPPASEFISIPSLGYIRLVQIRDYYTDAYATYVPESSKLRRCSESDVMLARYGSSAGGADNSLGRVCRGIAGAYNVALVKTIPVPGIDQNFLYYLLKTTYFQDPLLGRGTRSVQAGFSRSSIRSIGLPIPGREEQRAIVEVLSALDDKIAANSTLATTASRLSSTLFDYALPEGAVSDSTFENLAEIGGGGTPRTSVPEYWEGNVLWATPTDVTALSGPYLHETARRISDMGLTACSSRQYPAGSILMTSRATIGAFAVAAEPTAVNQGFIVVNPHDQHLRWWIFHEMRSRVDEFVAHANGATFLELSRGKFRKFTVRLADEAVMRKFNAEATALHDAARAALVESRQLAALRDALLPQLMSGKLRVKDAEKQVEEVV